MSKRIVQKEVNFCDHCGKESGYPHVCLKCGKEHCYDCSKSALQTFHHAVRFSGSADGEYCHECVRALSTAAPTEQGLGLFNAYLKIQRLRAEYEAFDKSFDARRTEAEAELKAFPRGLYG